MRDKNPYGLVEAEVEEMIRETPTISTVRMRPREAIPFEPGQFIQLTVPGSGEAPFTPSSHYAKTDLMDVSVMKVGRVTERIHALKPGDKVGLRGPFGSGYPLEDFKGHEVLVVGGGCGFAPLRALMYGLFDIVDDLKQLTFRGGCRTPSELVFHDEMENWKGRDDLNLRLTVDEGDEAWKGNVGVVTTILDDVSMDFPEAIGVVCGPPIMMKFATMKLLEMGFTEDHIYLSMEKNMSCAVGMCGHCRLGPYYCCTDGPVFQYSRIKGLAGIWD